MGKFKSFVDTPEGLFWFRRAYGILDNVGVSYCPDLEVDFVKGEGKVVIPLVAFVEDGVRIPLINLLTKFFDTFQIQLRLMPPQHI